MEQSSDLRYRLITILKVSVFLIFLGRAYQHIVWDAPYRTFLWDEGILKGTVESIFGIPWNDYVTSTSVANSISLFITIIGIFYVLCAIVTLMIKPHMKRLGKLFFTWGKYQPFYFSPFVL